MASSGFTMDEVYASDAGLQIETNQEETLQFGDFGSVNIQSTDRIADLSLNYVEDGSVHESELSYDMSAVVGSQNIDSDSKPEAEDEQKLFTLEEVLRIVEFSHKVLRRREVVSPVYIKQEEFIKQEHQVPVVASTTIPAFPSPRLQPTTAAGGQIRKVQRKDYCVITPDHTKSFYGR
jgi:hypothetical protein